MTTLVIITTHNRPEQYAAVCEAVLRHPGTKVMAFNDGSTVAYPTLPGVTRFDLEHHGRERYGQLVARANMCAQVTPWDRCAMLPDDVTPAVRDPLEAAEQAWQAIRDPDKLLLGMLVDRRGHVRQWGSAPTQRLGDVVLTGWNDLCWYSDKRIRGFLPSQYGPPGDDVNGSGIGRQWTRRLRPYGNLYCVHKTLWAHGDHASQMCPAEREAHPL